MSGLEGCVEEASPLATQLQELCCDVPALAAEKRAVFASETSDSCPGSGRKLELDLECKDVAGECTGTKNNTENWKGN